MSQTIDSRVVEMKFDNKNFEKNVAESMKTLENLDKRLTKLEQSDVHLDKVGKAASSIDLSKLDKSLDAITHRFSIMGQVGASVISNITTDAYNMVKNVGSKVWGTVFGQMKAGGKARASNVENAKFLLEGMGIAFSDSVDAAISDAVADTAFGYDEAAMAMAQLSGASVQLGDDMNQALKAISGVAAMTNRSFSDIADIFVDSAAAGKVAGDAFNRLGERGLAAKGIMQEFYGVTADELDKMARKGLISFNDFSKAMYDAFGTQAKKSNETLTGVLANTRAVLSRMGQSFYQPLMANNSDVVLFFQQLKDTLKGFEAPVKEIGKQLSGYVLALARYGTDFLKKIDVSKYQPMFDNLKKMFDNLYYAAQNLYSNILKPLGKQIKNALYEVFPSLNTGKGLLVTISDKILDLSQRFREFTADIGLFGEKGLAVKDIFVALFNAIKVGSQIIKSAMTLIGAGLKVIGSAITNFNLAGLLNNFTSFVALAAQIGTWIIAGIGVGLTSGVPMLFSAIAEVGKMIIDAFCSYFGIASPSKLMADKVGYWLTAGIGEGLKKALFAGLITAAILLVGSVIIKTLSGVGTDIQKVFDGIVNNIANTVNRFSKWISETAFGKAFKSAFELMATVTNKLSIAVESFNVEKLKQMLGVIKQFVMLGGYIYILIQFAAAATYFTSALRNIGVAAKMYTSSLYIKYFGATLKNLAISIGVITGSILLFAGMVKSNSWKELLVGLGVVTAIIVGLVVATNMLKGAFKAAEIDPKGVLRIEALFMGLSASIFLIASAIKKVGKLQPAQIATGIAGITLLIAELGFLVFALQKWTTGGFQLEKSWMLITSIGVTIRLIAGAIKSLTLLNMISPDAMWQATKQIALITGIIGAISVLTQVFSKLKSGQLVDNITNLNLPAMFLMIGIAVNLLAHAIKTLGKMGPEELERGKKTLYGIMGFLTLMLGVSIFAQSVLGTILLGFGATVAAIAGAIWLIGSMEEGVVKGFSALIAIMTVIVAFVGAVNLVNKATGFAYDDGSIRGLLWAGICIAAMGAVVYACGQLSLKQIAKGILVVAALSGFVAALGILFGLNKGSGSNLGGGKGGKFSFFSKANSKIDQFSRTLRIIAVIKTIVSALVSLAVAVVLMSKVITDYDKLTLAITSLSGIMGVLAILMVAASAVTENNENIGKITKPIVAITGALLVISGALLLLGNMESPATVITSMLAISVILVAIGHVLEKSKVFGVQGMGTKGILAAAVVVVAIGAALTLMIAAIGDFSPSKLGTVLLAVGAITAVLFAISGAMKFVDKVQISMKSVGAFLLSTLSLVTIAATVALFADYVEDLNDAIAAASVLGLVFFTIGVTLKIAETVNWGVAGAVLLGTLSFVAIAMAVGGLASYVEDMTRAREAAAIMGGVLLEMGVVLGVLTALATGTGGVAAGIILAIAGAFAIMGVSMMAASTGILIGVVAIERLVNTLTPENAHQIVEFFEIIGDGIGTAGQHIADGIKTATDAIHGATSAIKGEMESAGYDFVGGFASGITKSSPIAVMAAVALGALAIAGLRSKEGIDSHSPSEKAAEAGKDFDSGLGAGIADNADLAINPAKQLGTSIIDSLKGALSTGLANTSTDQLFANIKSSFSKINITELWSGLTNPTNAMKIAGKKSIGSVFATIMGNAEEQLNPESVLQNATKGSDGIGGWLESMFGGLTSGNFSNVLSGFDFSSILGENGIGGLKTYLDEAGVSMDNLSGDNIPKLIEKLKEGGLAGDDLIDALKELGITEDQIRDLGLAEKLGIEEAKGGIEETKEALESLADEIIKGKFGNAPERWDKMFEHLVKSGKTAEEAYAAIADAQNEVNKRLGSSVVHTADEMSKKVSESVKKANKATSDANAKTKSEPGKPGKDFKAEPFKSDSTTSKSDASKAADEQMKNNMPYANYIAAKHQQITGEMEKQTVEAYKQKLANEHIYTLKEKEQALASIKANQELAANSTLTSEKQKQLDAENKKYQKVVDTYNEQQKMVKAIQDQEAATKKAEEAEKKRGDVVKSNNKAVIYGSDEYYKQTSKSGGTINTVAARPKVETKPVETETKVEVTPKFEVKNADVSGIKKEVVSKVETEFKDLQAKATITPKIDTSQAETAIANFKQKTQDLKTTIPQTFSGIAADVSKNLSTIATKISQEGTKIVTTTKTVFQNAVNAATTALTGSETINKFVNAGKSAGQGYANGIRAKIADVRSAGTALGNTAIKATKAVTKTNSPSKIFTELGEWNGIGYGNGMIDSMKYVANASRQMGNTAMDEVYRIVNTVEDAVSNGLDITPTVTPVIDTTEIQNGISSINTVTDLTRGDLMSITANMTAKASYDDSQVEEMQTRLDAMRTAFNDLATVVSNQPTPVVEANVHLQGDADGVFKLVRDQDSVYTKMHGKSAFA